MGGDRLFCCSVEDVDDVLTQECVIFSVIVESADSGDFVSDFLGGCVLRDYVTVLRPARFAVFPGLSKTLVVEPLFVPVVLGEQLVKSAFAAS